MALASRLAPITALPARLRGRGTPLRIALAVALCAAAGLVHVHLRLQVIQAGYALSRETRLRHDLRDQNQKLRLELQTRRDPALVEKRARAELHMAPPDPAAIRTVRATAKPPAPPSVPPPAGPTPSPAAADSARAR